MRVGLGNCPETSTGRFVNIDAKDSAMTDEPKENDALEYVSPAPDLKTVYANVAGVKGGPFDAALDFGYVISPDAEGRMAPEWLIRVAMSWEHLIALHDLIGSQLANFNERADNKPSEE